MRLPEGIFYAFFMPDVPYKVVFAAHDFGVVRIIPILIRRCIDRDVEPGSSILKKPTVHDLF
jgi:hypothetical protein